MVNRSLTDRGNRDVSQYLKDLGIESVRELSLYCGLGVRQLHDWYNNKPLAFQTITEGYLYNHDKSYQVFKEAYLLKE